MIQQLLSLHKVVQVRAQVKAVADAQMESVATVAEQLRATWVILDQCGGSLLNRKTHSELIDPQLAHNYVDNEAECMFHAAMLHISPDPERRPCESKVIKILKILEGDLPSYAVSHDHGQ